MLIMTQSKTGLVNMGQVIRVFAAGGDIMAEDRNGAMTLLGTYEKTERCAEIVMEIAEKYASYIRVEGGPSPTVNAYDQPMMFEPPKLYQMPQEVTQDE